MMHNRKVYAKDKIGQAARDRGMDQAACQRQTQVDRLINAINDSDWRDAEVILSAFLAEYRAGPPVPALAQIKDEAENWASLSTYDELAAYFIACGQRLSQRNFGRRGRVQLAKRLLSGLPEADRIKAIASLSPQPDHTRSRQD